MVLVPFQLFWGVFSAPGLTLIINHVKNKHPCRVAHGKLIFQIFVASKERYPFRQFWWDFGWGKKDPLERLKGGHEGHELLIFLSSETIL